jgi:hypothetical protein
MDDLASSYHREFAACYYPVIPVSSTTDDLHMVMVSAAQMIKHFINLPSRISCSIKFLETNYIRLAFFKELQDISLRICISSFKGIEKPEVIAQYLECTCLSPSGFDN